MDRELASIKALLLVCATTCLVFVFTGHNLVWTFVCAVVSFIGSRAAVRIKYGTHSAGQRYIRGTRLTPAIQVRILTAYRLRKSHEKGFQWGRVKIPLSIARQHCLVAGTTRSGKTILARLMMQSVFPDIGNPKASIKTRALVYDGKAELLNVVYGMRQHYQEVHVLNPFHPNSARWDIARDVPDDASANQVADILFPSQDNESQPFFSNAVRLIASGLMKVFIERADKLWTLGDLIFVMRNSDRIQRTLELTQAGRDTLEQVFREGETLGNIVATIATKIQDYEVVASLMDHAATSVSLSEWVQGESIIVLQKHQKATLAVDSINRTIIARASQLLISRDDAEPSTWIVLDEVATAGELAGLHDFMDKGGSKGVCVVMAFQNISGLKRVYGEHGANSLTALCSTKAFLRFEDEVNAKWAMGFFGQQEIVNLGQNSSRSQQDVVTFSEFQHLSTPKGHPRKDIAGFFVAPVGKRPLLFHDSIPGTWLFNGHTLAPEAKLPFAERNPREQKLVRTEEDIKRLLLSPRELLLDQLAREGAAATKKAEPQQNRAAEALPTIATNPQAAPNTKGSKALGNRPGGAQSHGASFTKERRTDTQAPHRTDGSDAEIPQSTKQEIPPSAPKKRTTLRTPDRPRN